MAERLREYRPLAIVSALRMIRSAVEEARVAAGLDVPHYVVPFAGHGLQTVFQREMAAFQREMAALLPRLPLALPGDPRPRAGEPR